MSKEKKPLPFRIIKFIINLNWFIILFMFGLVSIFFIAVLAGFEPDALHIQIPVKIEYAEDENWLQFPDEDRPMILDITGEANVLVEREDIPFLEFRVIVLLIALGIYIFGSYHVRQFVKLVDLDQPFAPEIPKRLRFIGITLGMWGPFVGIAGYLQGKLTLNSITNIPQHLSIETDIHPEFIFMGLVLLVIAEIMKVGVKMQKEQSLTV